MKKFLKILQLIRVWIDTKFLNEKKDILVNKENLLNNLLFSNYIKLSTEESLSLFLDLEIKFERIIEERQNFAEKELLIINKYKNTPLNSSMPVIHTLDLEEYKRELCFTTL